MDRMIIATRGDSIGVKVLEGTKICIDIYGRTIWFFVDYERGPAMLSHYPSGYSLAKSQGKSFSDWIEILNHGKPEPTPAPDIVAAYVQGLVAEYGVEKLIQRFNQARVLNA